MSKYLVFCVATVGTGRGLSPVAGKVTAASRNQIWWTRGTGLGLVTADAMMYCNGEEAQSAVREWHDPLIPFDVVWTPASTSTETFGTGVGRDDVR
jgi:hypothetical protein